eukprot:CAMPEP_0198305106 /NCGR_PEP_ID=MMETSP1449-20131203/57740_1 /TAXON_ID=420275 /ORGANISM="Attheya septentrionalis, Strain CCMP2084" /LENGTH=524 /DNA_ID=CAMNT_0044007637 /DNA_START=218 /DNA_END=1792 /DNA_ORIENTATION=-
MVDSIFRSLNLQDLLVHRYRLGLSLILLFFLSISVSVTHVPIQFLNEKRLMQFRVKAFGFNSRRYRRQRERQLQEFTKEKLDVCLDTLSNLGEEVSSSNGQQGGSSPNILFTDESYIKLVSHQSNGHLDFEEYADMPQELRVWYIYAACMLGDCSGVPLDVLNTPDTPVPDELVILCMEVHDFVQENVPSPAPTTFAPSRKPSPVPTTPAPSENPSLAPTTSTPSMLPSNIPSLVPSSAPTISPSTEPTEYPTTSEPSPEPTISPSLKPTPAATQFPATSIPTLTPTSSPTVSPIIPLPGASARISYEINHETGLSADELLYGVNGNAIAADLMTASVIVTSRAFPGCEVEQGRRQRRVLDGHSQDSKVKNNEIIMEENEWKPPASHSEQRRLGSSHLPDNSSGDDNLVLQQLASEESPVEIRQSRLDHSRQLLVLAPPLNEECRYIIRARINEMLDLACQLDFPDKTDETQCVLVISTIVVSTKSFDDPLTEAEETELKEVIENTMFQSFKDGSFVDAIPNTD